ncbi:MAG: HAD family hydrolase [Actinomycetota bacterium]
MVPANIMEEELVGYRALVVDYGGVLTTPLQDAMIAFSADIGIELQDLVRVALKAYAGHEDSLVHDFETGTISEEEFSADLAARLKEEAGVEVEPEGLVRRLFAGMQLEEDMMTAVVMARRAGLKTALLSNSWGLSLYPRDRFPEMFDVVVISGEIGMRKPDPQIFHATTDQLSLEPQECVFVDDHPGHLQAAAEVGMTTVLHRTPTDTITELEQLLNIPLRP